MTLQDLEKEFNSVILMPFKGLPVRVLRNKETNEWAFYKEENGQLLTLPEEILKELLKIYKPKPYVDYLKIKETEEFTEFEFKNDYITTDKKQTKQVKKFINIDGKKFLINYVSIAHQGGTNRIPKVENGDFNFLRNVINILKDYGYKTKQAIKLIQQKLDGYVICYDDTCPNTDYGACNFLDIKTIHVLPTLKNLLLDLDSKEIQPTLVHEVLHSLTTFIKNDKIFGCGLRTKEKGRGINEIFTGILAGSGYYNQQSFIKCLFGEKLPKELGAAYFECNLRKVCEIFKNEFGISEDFFNCFVNILDSYFNILDDSNYIINEENKQMLRRHEIKLCSFDLICKLNQELKKQANAISYKELQYNYEFVFESSKYIEIINSFINLEHKDIGIVLANAFFNEECYLKELSSPLWEAFCTAEINSEKFGRVPDIECLFTPQIPEEASRILFEFYSKNKNLTEKERNKLKVIGEIACYDLIDETIEKNCKNNYGYEVLDNKSSSKNRKSTKDEEECLGL